MSSNAPALAKLSHADSDRRSRLKKAERIETILRRARPELASLDALDVGTGSGMIASYFRPMVHSLHSVDVVDERIDTDFPFTLMVSEALPFPDSSFDIAISNHVIEHVDNQLLHLSEIARVLRPGGVCYLATPNRLWPIEPHFNLPFLAWLPSQRLRDAYVRRARRGSRYDACLLTFTALARLASQAQLDLRDVSFDLANLILGGRAPLELSIVHAGWPIARLAAPSLAALLRKP